MTCVIPEVGISYELEYYERYKAGIRVTYSPNDSKFFVKADSRVPRSEIDRFMREKSPLFMKWINKAEAKQELTLPNDSRSASFKNRLLKRCEDLMVDYEGPRAISYKVSYSKSYWGRCSADKVISISAYCNYLTDEQLFYVLMHEHAHLIHMHHKPAFWNLVENYCPNYKSLRNELKGYTLK
ncbi:MAG: M48 family metallopeptidase [Clostridiales bacterium]|nr:M48 family metallopeptidase [Clostridiales bacterium]